MSNVIRERSTHSDHLERWLGAEAVDGISQAMQPWYGPKIAVGGVPGAVYSEKGGDFTGRIRAGYEANWMDRAEDWARRLGRGARVAARRHSRGVQLNAGFTSLSDLIAEATAGKRREFQFNKVGATGVASVTNSMWRLGPLPAAGANASAAPGGDALTDATVGAFPFTNPTGGDTQHFVSGFPLSDRVSTLLLYDRLFQVDKTMNSTATQAVTGVPTRYQATVAGDDSAAGNFLFVEVGLTALAATAHNWTVCLYTNQAGTGGQTLPSLVGNASAIVNRLDHPIMQWFAPLASGDTGIQKLTQMQCSALVATGQINFVMGHPIAWMGVPVANLVCVTDGINTSFNLARIFDDAALAFLEVAKNVASNATITGTFTTVAG